MDLVPKHPFTKALLELDLGLQTEGTARKTLKKPAGTYLSKKFSMLKLYLPINS